MKPLLSAEMLKLSRQPAILFWGFLSVPLVALLFKLVVEGLLFVRLGRQGGDDVDIFLSAAKSLNLSGNSIGQLIYAIGIASVFFLEYRHATWRVLVPRQPRVQLFAAKGLLCLMWLALGLLVAAIGDAAINLGLSVLKGQGGGPVFSRASFVIFVAAFGVALLELTVLTAFVATLVVFFRSMIAAVIPAFLLAIGSTVLQLYLGADADRLPLPSYAAQWMRDWVIMGGSPLAALTGLGVLAGWAIILFALGLYLFSRQQLATE